jgi:hypothetical protein
MRWRKWRREESKHQLDESRMITNEAKGFLAIMVTGFILTYGGFAVDYKPELRWKPEKQTYE